LEIFRSVLDVLANFFMGRKFGVEPIDNRRPVAAASQLDDLRKAIPFPELDGCTEAIPAKRGANALMQFAVL
jgi:hypothetical protein